MTMNLQRFTQPPTSDHATSDIVEAATFLSYGMNMTGYLRREPPSRQVVFYFNDGGDGLNLTKLRLAYANREARVEPRVYQEYYKLLRSMIIESEEKNVRN